MSSSVAVPDFLKAPPRHPFFTGKGEVGETSLACASAVWLADQGCRVLILEPFARVINASFAASHPEEPVLRPRAHAELSQISKIKAELAHRVALIPFQAEEPVGIGRLTALAASASSGGSMNA